MVRSHIWNQEVKEQLELHNLHTYSALHYYQVEVKLMIMLKAIWWYTAIVREYNKPGTERIPCGSRELWGTEGSNVSQNIMRLVQCRTHHIFIDDCNLSKCLLWNEYFLITQSWCNLLKLGQLFETRIVIKVSLLGYIVCRKLAVTNLENLAATTIHDCYSLYCSD
jgi:hypothetical protein